MSIITGRGDSGETDLLFGKRIPKGSLRVECLGAVDELNAALGVARAETAEGDWVELVDKIQAVVFANRAAEEEARAEQLAEELRW